MHTNSSLPYGKKQDCADEMREKGVTPGTEEGPSPSAGSIPHAKSAFGRGKGVLIMAKDFDAPLDDFEDYMWSAT